MERCDTCKCSPCRCSKCCHILAPLAVLGIAIVILLGNLGVITADVTRILWPCLLGLAALLKIIEGCCKKCKPAHSCPPGCRCDKCCRDKSMNPHL